MGKILLIDDEGVVRGALRAVLSQAGHSVTEARDGSEGLALLRKDEPDLIILDRDLPDMRGSEALKAIRAARLDVPVIVLTGNAGAPGEEKYRALGVSAFLSKGMDIQNLLKVIERELSASARSRRRILIVDDDAAIRTMLTRFLEGKGYAVSTAVNGKEGLECLERARPDLILLDIDMPELGGVEVLRRLRAAGKEVPVMMISGNGDLETARRCLALGACDYIVKPLNLEYLETSVWMKMLTAVE